MYTETRNNFSIRDVILQFLFVALFIFILIWLFPMKSDMKKAISSLDNSSTTDLSILTDRFFNENVESMKEAAQSYFTTSRLPQKVGDKVKLTLGQMLDKKIILPFTDKNGKQCDLKGSYVEISKKDNEFVMKINLKCGEEENYVLVYMGCYDYCSQTICEKKSTTTTKRKVYTVTKAKKYYCKVVNGKYYDKNGKVVTKAAYKKSCEKTVTPDKPEPTPEISYRYLYEYKKISDGTSKYTDWSEWTTNAIAATSDREVKYKKTQVKKLVAYKQTTSDDLSKPITAVKDVVVGSKSVTSCASYNVTSTITGYTYNYLGTFKYSVAPKETATYTYEKVGDYSWYCDSNCTAGTVMVYKKYQKVPTTSTSYSCASYDTSTSVYVAQQRVVTGYEKKTTTQPVYEYTTKTYYSYRTKISTPGTIMLKWSTYNDTTLLNDGYNYTGNTKTEIVSK